MSWRTRARLNLRSESSGVTEAELRAADEIGWHFPPAVVCRSRLDGARVGSASPGLVNR